MYDIDWRSIYVISNDIPETHFVASVHSDGSEWNIGNIDQK